MAPSSTLPLISRRFNYLLASLALFALEVAIALWVQDAWVRPFVGDVLVVVLLYTAGRACGLPPSWSYAVFLVACSVEILQAFHWVERLGLADSRLARIVLGTTFSWGDFGAYASGYLLTRLDPWAREVHPTETSSA